MNGRGPIGYGGGRHPHGGEGNCGGNEGHGSAKRERAKAAPSRARAQEKPKASPKTDAAPESSQRNLSQNREWLREGIKASVVLSEPLCRKNGFYAYGRRRNGGEES